MFRGNLKIALASAFALILISYTISSRFNLGVLFGNVISGTSDTPQTALVATTTPFTESLRKSWEESLREYSTITPENTASSSHDTYSSVTEAFGRALFGTYLNERKNGNLSSSEKRTTFVKEQINGLLASIDGASYSINDIHIDTTVTIESYFNAIGSIFIENSTDNEHELLIFQRVVESGSTLNESNKVDLQKLVEIANLYTTMTEQTLDTPVPASLRNEHIKLITALESIAVGISGMSKYFSDPIVAIANLKLYNQGTEKLHGAVRALQAKGASANVSFTKTDPGYLLMNL